MRLPIVSVLIVFFLWGAVYSRAQTPASQELIRLVNDPRFRTDAVAHSSVEAGPDAIPFLRDFLDRPIEQEQRSRALMALAYIGGDTAISLIRKEYENGSTGAEFWLALALSTEDIPENRSSLIEFVKRESTNQNWHTNEQAAWSLGLLRAAEATSALRMAAERPPKIFGPAEVLRWIESGYFPERIQPVTEEDRMIAAVLRIGIPAIRDETPYTDFDRKGFWERDSRGWTFSKENPGKKTGGMISFKPFVSSDGSRGLVSVSIVCGLGCGNGYDYVLRKEGSEWKVQAMRHTSIS